MAANIDMIKKISVYSAIFGAALAVLALIPAIMPIITLCILPFLSALIIFTILRFTEKNKNVANSLDIKEYAVLGAGIGGISGFSFLIIFTPLVLLIHFFFKDYYAYGINYLNFFVAFVFIVTISIIILVTNAGGGLLAGFLIKQLDKFKQQQ